MGRSVNRVLLIGRVGKDPEVKHTSASKPFLNLSLATTDSWKDKSGNKQEHTEWHKLVFWGKLAEIAGKYLRKGSLVYIEGHLNTNKWQDQSGQDRYTTQVVADQMVMLGEKSKPNQQQDQQAAQDDFYTKGDDIPF